MAEIEKKLVQKKAGAIRGKLRRQKRSATPEEQMILDAWDRLRSKSGRRSPLTASAPTERGIESDELDADDTIEDAQPSPADAIPEAVEDAPESSEPRKAPPAPPRVSASARVKGKPGPWIDKYKEGGAGAGNREQTCRFAVNLTLQKIAVPCIEYHERYGADCPVSRADLFPVGEGDAEVRPPVFNDGVQAANLVIPEEVTLPPGLVFGATMLILAWSTYKLKKEVSRRVVDAPSVATAPASNGNGIHVEEKKPTIVVEASDGTRLF
jgi:hypothetical protein